MPGARVRLTHCIRPDPVTPAKGVSLGYLRLGGVVVGPAGAGLPLEADPAFSSWPRATPTGAPGVVQPLPALPMAITGAA